MQDNKILTTRELAKYMKLNEKTVLKMAQKRALPGVKIGNQWRFHLNAIDKYLQRTELDDPVGELNTVIETAQQIIPLSRLVDDSLINLDLQSTRKKDILFELATTARKASITPSRSVLVDELEKREQMLSTALGNGVAVPHPRNPKTTLFQRPNIVIGRSEKGVEFFAPDGKMVHLFFMICAPNMLIHLKLLAKISRVLQTKNVIASLLKAASADEVIRLLLEIERKSVFPD